MENNNNSSMLERLSTVLGSTEQPNKPSLRTRLKDEELAASLLSQYRQALISYLNAIGTTVCPEPLNHPFEFFYFHQSKRTLYTTFDSFRNGDRLKSKIINPQTFPSFLVNVCLIPHVKGERTECLYNALFELIKDFPGDKLSNIINRIKYYDSGFAKLIQDLLPLLQSSIGNLYFDTSDNNLAPPYSWLRYQPIFNLANRIPRNVPANLIKSLLQEVSKSDHPNSRLYTLKEYTPTHIENIFGNLGLTVCIPIFYSHESDKFIANPLPISEYYIAMKYTVLFRNRTVPSVPDGAFHFLQILCRDSLSLANQLSMFLSLAMSPSEGGVTVLLTQAPEFLAKTLTKIFYTTPGFSPSISSKRKLSFNLLSKRSVQCSLFIAQEQGASVAFIADTPPSDSNLPKIKKLLKGNTIPLKTQLFPIQHYQNKLHFICVTSDLKKASVIQNKLKANLIELSTSEIPPDGGTLQLTDQDLHWLRTTFLLHGLKLRTLQAAGIETSPQEEVSKYPTVKESIDAFLSECCWYEETTFCSLKTVYETYCHYISATQNGRDPLIGKNTFKTKFESALTHKSALKNIRYGRLRHPDNGASESGHGNRALFGYKGLKLILPSPEVAQDQLLKEDEVSLRDYLNQISQYNIHFDGIVEATLTIPESKKEQPV